MIISPVSFTSYKAFKTSKSDFRNYKYYKQELEKKDKQTGAVTQFIDDGIVYKYNLDDSSLEDYFNGKVSSELEFISDNIDNTFFDALDLYKKAKNNNFKTFEYNDLKLNCEKIGNIFNKYDVIKVFNNNSLKQEITYKQGKYLEVKKFNQNTKEFDFYIYDFKNKTKEYWQNAKEQTSSQNSYEITADKIYSFNNNGLKLYAQEYEHKEKNREIYTQMQKIYILNPEKNEILFSDFYYRILQ